MGKELFLMVLFLFACSGCAGTESTRFYLLSQEANPAPVWTEQADLHIAVASIRFPEYLNRSQIVTRFSENELELGWLDRWGEPLDRNFSRIMTQNLEQLLRCRCTSVLVPKPSPDITYRLEVDVIKMDGVLGEKAWLEARWSIFTPEKKVLMTRKSSFTRPIEAPGYESFVQIQSRLLFDLSRDIAVSIAGMGVRN